MDMKPQLTIRYCGLCKITTKHNDSDATSICQRCGVIKTRLRAGFASKVSKPVSAETAAALPAAVWKQTA
jgi:hypothetical protein